VKPLKRRAIQGPFQDKVFDVFNFLFITLFLIIVLYPLVFIISASFSDPYAVTKGRMWLWPVDFSTEGYRRVFIYRELWVGYRNTLVYASSTAVIQVIIVMMAGYAMTREYFPGKKLITILFMIPMFFGGGLIPFYLIIRSLGLYDKFYTIPVLSAGVGLMGIVIVRTFIQTSIPDDLQNAASIDGCSSFATFFRIILPLAGPIMAVNALFAAVGQWNSYYNALIFLKTRAFMPLQIFLREVLVLNTVDYTQVQFMAEDAIIYSERARVSQMIKYSIMIVSTLPIIMLYPFLQRYFVKGIMVGSIKG